MGIFWLGGPKVIVPDDKLVPEMQEDRFFLPGIIHGGEDYLIRVYLNDVCQDDGTDEFIVEYLSKDLILKAYQEDPECVWPFHEYLANFAECYGCLNDGAGDFATLVEMWPKAIQMSNSDLVRWAKGTYDPYTVKRNEAPEFIGQTIDIFEDFLESKGIEIPNDEKAQDPDAAIIYGSDYGLLESELREMFAGWGLLQK